jgi:glycosyltransferase involved in cell wall biosynthesis
VKVLHLYKDYPPILGGIENHVRLLAEAQAARGHEVSVLVTNPAGARTEITVENDVRVIRAARFATIASTPLSIALASQLWRQQPEIAHLHFPYPFGDVMQMCFGRARRRVITYHSDIVRQKNLLRVYAPLLRRSLARADRIIAASPRYVETSAFLAPCASNCTVIPYGIELGSFASADPVQVAEIQARYGAPLILFVGRLRYYKGIEYLIRAMTQVPAQLLLIGSDATTRRSELERLAGEIGVAERVHFLGERQTELTAFYHASDLFVLPSVERSEAFGIVQIEAMAAGKPVVCTELGTGTSFVNQDGVTGWVVPSRDPDALAHAIIRLLEDASMRARMGSAARDRANAEFGADLMVDRVLAVYASVLA